MTSITGLRKRRWPGAAQPARKSLGTGSRSISIDRPACRAVAAGSADAQARADQGRARVHVTDAAMRGRIDVAAAVTVVGDD